MLSKKRSFDLFSSIFILILVAPLAALAYPVLLYLVGNPIVFTQERIGKDGKKFKLYKLRSMRKNADSIKKRYSNKNEAPWPMFKIANDPRFLKKEVNFFIFKKKYYIEIGKFLSRYGLDEIPQIINIIKGDMSLVGPRPLPTQEAEALKQIDKTWHKWRHSVKPGIFSIWAADSEHNKSFSYWKKLEKETLKMNTRKQAKIAVKIILKQMGNILKERL